MDLNDPVNLEGIVQAIYFLAKINSSTFNYADVLRIVNNYYFQCVDIIMGINEDYFLVQATGDITTGDGTYTFPDGTGTAPTYRKMKYIKAALSPNNVLAPQPGEYVKCVLVSPNQISDDSYVFSQPTCIIYGAYFVLQPLSTVYITNGLKVAYVADQPLLALNTDVPNIPLSLRDAIVYGALTEIAPRIGNQALEAKAKEAWKQRKADIAEFASNRIMDMAGDVVEGQNASGGWAYPFGQGDSIGVANVTDGS